MTLDVFSDPHLRSDDAILASGGFAELKTCDEISAPGSACDPIFPGIVGCSPALRQVLQLVEMVAASDATVLILGETGTGKELVARAIHERSQRHKQAFVTLNCAAIPSSLFESELFGHERGAFTGANMQRAGRLELADRGTLFLDEVGEMPLELQQMMEDKQFRSDLYYRLNVFPIRIPPLRERREDIPLLVQHFTQKYAR